VLPDQAQAAHDALRARWPDSHAFAHVHHLAAARVSASRLFTAYASNNSIKQCLSILSVGLRNHSSSTHKDMTPSSTHIQRASLSGMPAYVCRLFTA